MFKTQTLQAKAAKQKQANKTWYLKNRRKILAQKKAEYAANPQAAKAKSAAKYKANRPAILGAMKADARRKKLLVYQHYGLSCQCCGESNYGFLTIDHIEGCTKSQRKLEGSGSRLYGYLIKNQFPDGYRTLCWNCNGGRAMNGGICPHRDPTLLTTGRVKPFNLDEIGFGSLDVDLNYLE